MLLCVYCIKHLLPLEPPPPNNLFPLPSSSSLPHILCLFFQLSLLPLFLPLFPLSISLACPYFIYFFFFSANLTFSSHRPVEQRAVGWVTAAAAEGAAALCVFLDMHRVCVYMPQLVPSTRLLGQGWSQQGTTTLPAARQPTRQPGVVIQKHTLG